MHVSNMLPSWSPSMITNRLVPHKATGKPFRVWVLGNHQGSVQQEPIAVGVMAASLMELKEKVWNSIKSSEDNEIKLSEISVLRLTDETSIIDDDFLLQVPCTDDLVLLLPGQSWERLSDVSTDTKLASLQSKSLVKRNRRCNYDDEHSQSDLRYFVPTPKGEVARLTLDIFKEKPTDAGCLRLTAATAGDAAVSVAYELRLNGARAIFQHLLRWTAILLTYAGKVMVQTGEYIKHFSM